jgi:GR25 family glycosyltransferase involved in LPS biosynthesis/tetratricopeptide (TPR) repeat protein
MIVKNEAHIIADTLKHLWNYIQFDYWVISDTGSTDQTREIVKAFFAEKGINGELQEEPWRDFGYNRTKAFEAAYKKADYAFVWDADDEISGDFKLPADLTADSYKFVFGNAEGMRYSRGQLFSMNKRWCYRGVLHEYADCLEPAGPMVDVGGDYFFISGRRGDRSKDPNKYLKDALVLEKAAEKALAEKDPLYNRYIFYCAQSYNSCNMKEKAIEFYKKALTLPLWIQEKYVSCMEIYDKYDELGKPEEGLYYLIESYKHDTSRLECFYRLIKYYCIHGPVEVAYAYYTVIQNFYENHYDGSKLGEKLFAKKNEYDFFLPYYMIIVSERAGKLKTCAKMYETIFKHQYAFAGEWWIRNLIHNMQFCIKELPDDLRFVNNFFTYMTFLRGKGVRLEPSQLVVVNKMIHRYKDLLGSSVKPSFNLTATKPTIPIKVMLTMTSCKRWDLFEKTVNSLLHTWTDIDKVDYFFCVDDNSSQRDRTKMKAAFPFIDFYMKRQSERGHRASMNIIYDMLKTLKPTYWIHMEDDWLFFQKDSYVQKSIDFLDRNEGKNIHQILYNRNYAETYEGWTINGGEAIEGSPGFLLHVKSDSIPGQNCGYWPHYSFRPSMIRTSAILELGNYDSPNTFFERDYADKYFARGYKSAFFDTVCCLHTGKLTSDKTGTNAYTLNKTGQFNGDKSLTKQEVRTFVINLLRRTDRKEAMEVEFEKAGLDGGYEFFEAVDGKELTLTDEINTLFLGNDFGSRKGVIGCALSHYALWKQLVASDSEYYTIFEDDVKLSDNFKAKWEEACKSESDITFLGFTSRDRAVRTTEAATPLVELDLGKYIGGFFGYMIRKPAAKKLVEYISQKGIKHGIDYLVKVVPGLKCSAVQPHIVQTEWFSSSESKVDTDIQKDYSSLQIQAAVNEAEWDFYEGVDSGGGDMTRSESRDPKGLMAAAASQSECVAFNTLGYLKSRVRFPLIKSPWLHAPDGLYVKKGYKPIIRIKMLCNWCSSEDLCKEWLKMCKGANTYKWNDLEITWSDEDIDYYVIINKPRPGDKYIAEKSIIYHMEPWCAGKDQNWGIKTWGQQWANPDPKLFLQVRTHDRFANTVFWQLNLTYDQLQTMDMEAQKRPDLDKVVSSICSSKYYDPGHKKRIDFLKYLEEKEFPLHIYNEDNQQEFKSYQGKARPSVDKEKGLVPYKYYFMCENNAERNFVTEKLWEPILCESLCFYWGCPNVADIVDPRAYVQLDMNDFESAYNTINAAIQMNLWEERLPYIKAAKQKILENSFFPILEKVLKPKAVCFIHSCHLPSSGTEKLDLVLDAVLKVKELEVITINNIGLRLHHAKYEAMDPRIMVIHCSDNSQEFELPTLRLMHEFSLNSPNTKVLYVHTKGISYPKGDSRYEPGLDWINYMLHFLCEKSEHCLKLLDTHDVAGCNFSELPKPHFSGNFWWATTKYLKSLDTALLTDKMSAEWWLQSSPVKPVKAVLWNSGKNHFHERYPEEEYNIKKTLVIYTYFASPSSDYNLDFYSKAAISYSKTIDFIIVVNGHKCNVKLPELANLKVIYRDNTGFDFGGHKAALDSLGGKQYDYYFFMNSGVLGPFLHDTHPKGVHWTEPFIKKITNKVKLVSTSIFPSGNHASSESFCFMTDKIGLNLFINNREIFYNCKTKYDAIGCENALSQCIFNNGYTIDCMLEKFKGVNWLDKANWSLNNCQPPSRKNKYFNKSIDPFEVIFHKWYWENPADSMVSYDIVSLYVNNFFTKPSISIFVVFHNALFDHLYSEMSESDKTSIVTYGVKTRVPSPFKTIYEADLPEYNPRLQKDVYNEGSAFYHIYKNRLYKDGDYIGFGQYDMKIKSNTLTDIRKTINSSKSPCIFVMDYFPDIKKTGFLGCHNLIKSDLNALESGLTTYNRAFNTSYTPNDVIQNRLIMCNTFVIHRAIFEKMMSWLMQYYRDDINVNRHPLIGNAGQIPEALIGMFLSLEVLQGATYYKFDVEHIWPLYKNIANTKYDKN